MATHLSEEAKQYLARIFILSDQEIDLLPHNNEQAFYFGYISIISLWDNTKRYAGKRVYFIFPHSVDAYKRRPTCAHLVDTAPEFRKWCYKTREGVWLLIRPKHPRKERGSGD